jgi:hypothetical protein
VRELVAARLQRIEKIATMRNATAADEDIAESIVENVSRAGLVALPELLRARGRVEARGIAGVYDDMIEQAITAGLRSERPTVVRHFALALAQGSPEAQRGALQSLSRHVSALQRSELGPIRAALAAMDVSTLPGNLQEIHRTLRDATDEE